MEELLAGLPPLLPKRVRDLTGETFGLLTVKGYGGVFEGIHQWVCSCKCGKSTIKGGGSLRNGTRSCGCLRTGAGQELISRVGDGASFVPRPRTVGGRDWTGYRRGKLEVVGRAECGGGWLARCECGVECVKSEASLSSGVQSCGCLRGRPREPLAAFNAVYRRWRRRATKGEVEWDLDAEQFMEVVGQPCMFCDAEPAPTYAGGLPHSYPMRVKMDVGYVPGNVVPCCQNCHRARGKLTVGQFKEWLGGLLRKLG